MGKVAKSVSKAVSKTVKSVNNVIKPITGGTGKILSGNIGEGLGDIGQAGARMGLDIATAGNKDKLDAISGGALTAAENAARGNTKDMARVGITAGAVAVGGPMAGLAVNTAFAQGASPLGAIATGVAGSSPLGATGVGIASNFMDLGIPNAGNPAPTIPYAPANQAPIIIPQAPAMSPSYGGGGGLDKNTMLMVGGGVVALMMMMMMINKGK